MMKSASDEIVLSLIDKYHLACLKHILTRSSAIAEGLRNALNCQ